MLAIVVVINSRPIAYSTRTTYTTQATIDLSDARERHTCNFFQCPFGSDFEFYRSQNRRRGYTGICYRGRRCRSARHTPTNIITLRIAPRLQLFKRSHDLAAVLGRPFSAVVNQNVHRTCEYSCRFAIDGYI